MIKGTVRDSWGVPQENIEIFLQIERLDGEGVRPLKTLAKTGKDGYFEFPKLSPGRYSLAAGPMGDPDFEVPTFYLGPDEVSDQSMEIPTRVTLRVDVFNEEDRAVPRAKVTLTSKENRSSNRWAHSNLQGEAYLRYVEQGSYTLEIKAPGYETHEEDFEVPYHQGLQEAVRTLKIPPSDGG
jgi:hypothetical protein